MFTETVNKKLFTVDEFHRLAEVGILPEDGRFELIRGEIIDMGRAGPPHAGRVNRLVAVFTSAFGRAVIVSVQNPLAIDLYSEPLPDLALLKARANFYTDAHPGPDDVLLLVEVSHTTVSYDKNVKAPLYAECAVPEYWQLDVKRDVVIVRTDPLDGEYQNIQIFRRGETVTIQRSPGFSFLIDEILGPPSSAELNS